MSTKDIRQLVTTPTHAIVSDGTAEASNVGYRPLGDFKANLGLGTSLTQTANNGNGTAGTPAFAFVGDENTGIYRPGADTLGFSTNGSEKVRIDSAGNVGIGTTDPKAKSHVLGSKIIQPRVDSGKLFKAVFSSSASVTTDLLSTELISDNHNIMVIVDVISSRGTNAGSGIVRYMTGAKKVSGTITAEPVTEISASELVATNAKATLSWAIVGNIATLSANNNFAFCTTMYEVTVARYSFGAAQLTFIG